MSFFLCHLLPILLLLCKYCIFRTVAVVLLDVSLCYSFFFFHPYLIFALRGTGLFIIYILFYYFWCNPPHCIVFFCIFILITLLCISIFWCALCWNYITTFLVTWFVVCILSSKQLVHVGFAPRKSTSISEVVRVFAWSSSSKSSSVVINIFL